MVALRNPRAFLILPTRRFELTAFRLERHNKAVGFATVNVQIRPGLREGGQ